ncbi:peptidoglycan-binding domain-containing protein [Bacillus mojavensis]|nr:peptidoglycan-binding domain-containing protein [Bacillus mojavensis]MEC1680133.1 peptidoglycan-binding domain-containing protein [Bacillus mojavensis]MEC1714133.1 peptidoglycan-binding domain-containing protein [Bacillus mojavensis]MEC1735845.1 peptidoglycan-binding domain-containing protein [Bacillus mojavensis]MEC1794524.1 peptidoglycan-binding domain-containing protein [Bacillus mojavensis]
MQKSLAALYLYRDKGAKNNDIDGVYGPKTADAVRRFQLMDGLSADGIYRPKTKAKLEALSKRN